MSTFAAVFREHVTPDLQRLIKATAPCVAMCVMTFGEACESIMANAIRRGATSLPDDVFLDLRNWISTQLFLAIEAWENATPGNKAAAEASRDRWAE